MLKLQLLKNKLTVTSSKGIEKSFKFPAVAVSIKGERIEAATCTGEEISGKTICRRYCDGGIEFEVKVTPAAKGDWFFKELTLKSDSALPTPDYVELDCQKVPAGGMKRRGYIATTSDTKRPGAEEEGGGLMPGCGYPVMGRELFAGVEHPAAFNTVNSDKTYTLRQHPVWEKGIIRTCRAVTGMGSDPE